jgi:hypothetical protein
MIHFHIAYPGGSIDGSFSIAPCPIIEHLAPSNAHSPSSSSFVAPSRTTGASQATVTEISFSNASPKLAAGAADHQPAGANTHPHLLQLADARNDDPFWQLLERSRDNFATYRVESHDLQLQPNLF